MEILKNGRTTTYSDCYRCNCEFLFEKEDVYGIESVDHHITYCVDCPCCGATIPINGLNVPFSFSSVTNIK